jgi:hypothetical protein
VAQEKMYVAAQPSGSKKSDDCQSRFDPEPDRLGHMHKNQQQLLKMAKMNIALH